MPTSGPTPFVRSCPMRTSRGASATCSTVIAPPAVAAAPLAAAVLERTGFGRAAGCGS